MFAIINSNIILKENYQTAFENPGIIPKPISSRVSILESLNGLTLFERLVNTQRLINLVEKFFFFFLIFENKLIFYMLKYKRNYKK